MRRQVMTTQTDGIHTRGIISDFEAIHCSFISCLREGDKTGQ